MSTWNQLINNSCEEVLVWAEDQPWAKSMAGCQQDEHWHAEGDVWAHTKQVCNELFRLEDWKSLSELDKRIVLLGCLLHDAAKPATSFRDPVDGRIHSPKHAIKGEFLARQILMDLDCPFHSRELICSLVRKHSAPVHLFSKENPTLELAKLSWLTRIDLLYLLALADGRGRDSESSERDECDLLLFAQMAREEGCFHKSFDYVNPTARVLAGRNQLSDCHRVPHEDFRSRVIVMSGLPGSGKDTWLKKHRANLPVVSLDEIRKELIVDPTKNQGPVVQAAKEKCRELLRAGQDFAFNATNITKILRTQWIDLFLNYQAHVTLVYVEAAWNRIKQQNKGREEIVPENVLVKLARRLEPPNRLEAHEVIYEV